jgi:hypothetical protein
MMPDPSYVDEEDLNVHERMVKRVCFENNSNDCSHDDDGGDGDGDGDDEDDEDENKNDDQNKYKNVFVGLRDQQVRENNRAIIQSVIDGDSSDDDTEQNSRVATSLTDEEVRRHLHYIMFGMGSDDIEDEDTFQTGGNDEQDQYTIDIPNKFYSLIDGSDDDLLHSITQSIQEEGSISSIDLDDLDRSFQEDILLESRKCTHVANETITITTH